MIQGLLKHLTNERGEVGDPSNGTYSQTTPWHTPIVESLKATDPDVAAWLPTRPEKDLGGVLKSHYNLEKKLGSAVIPPGKDAKPEDIAAFRKRVYDTGVFKAPPESPDKYEIRRPDAVPENLWNKEFEDKVRSVFHKRGLDSETAAELMGLHNEFVSNVKAAIEVDTADSLAKLETWAKERGLTAKHAETYAGQWLANHASPQEIAALNASGLGNHPALISLIAKAGMDTGEDISNTQGALEQPTGAMEARKEYNEIIDVGKKHPMGERWRRGDPEAIAYVNALMMKAWPGEQTL